MNFGAIIDSCRNEIVRNTQDLIRIKSVQGTPEPGMPYGKGPYEALKYVLDLSESLGFDTKNLDGHAGYAEFGDGDETVGVLVHVDVVPAGGDWTFPPFEGEIHDCKIYGRGSTDDKGPAVAVLYALKSIKESGERLKKKIRVVFGADEESGFDGIHYYLSKEKAFDVGFSPDANFPVINGEKGVLVFKLCKEVESPTDGDIRIKSIQGGTAPNMVPGSCTAVIGIENGKKQLIADMIKEFRSKYGYDIESQEDGSGLILRSRGKTAHASTPEEGLNAISVMMLFLKELKPDDKDVYQLIKMYNDKIGFQYNGESIGCSFCDTVSGKLTMNIGLIDLTGQKFELIMDIRYPVSYNADEIVNIIESAMTGTGITIEQLFSESPLYIPENHFLVQKLMKVYRNMSDDRKSKPIVVGGATYARAMKNVVAFGPVFPGEVELAHQRDEYIDIEKLISITKVYAAALYELSK